MENKRDISIFKYTSWIPKLGVILWIGTCSFKLFLYSFVFWLVIVMCYDIVIDTFMLTKEKTDAVIDEKQQEEINRIENIVED